jgi:hypothetical protein
MSILCPHCHSRQVRNSRTKGMLESVLLALVFLRPFRCEDCDLRFFHWSIHKKYRPRRPRTT